MPHSGTRPSQRHWREGPMRKNVLRSLVRTSRVIPWTHVATAMRVAIAGPLEPRPSNEC